VLPGHDDTGGRWCAGCANIDGFVCTRCGAVDEPMSTIGVCARCRARNHVVVAICDDTEPSGTALAIVNVLCTRSPWTLHKWLANSPDLIAELRAAAAGRQELSHAGLDALGDTRRVEHLRQLLVAAGLLPARHHQLALFDRWCQRLFATIDNIAHRQTITTFATWHHRRRLAAAIDNGTLKPASTRGTRRHIRAGRNFLTWLEHRDVALADCRQADIDRWFSTGNTTRWSALGFITWARSQRLCDRRLQVPIYRSATPATVGHDHHVTVVARLLHDDTITLTDRVAGLLVALYAQPVTRVSRLRHDAIVITDQQVTAEIGAERIVLDDPIAPLVTRLVADSAHSGSPWLFPGVTAGQPRSAHGLGERLRRHGVSKGVRIAAFHDLIEQVPATVLAELIDYNPVVVAKRAEALAAQWNTTQHCASRSRAAQPKMSLDRA